MAEQKVDVNTFVQQVRRRLNRHLWLDLMIHGLSIAAALLLVIGLCYLLRGSYVPRMWYPLVWVPALVSILFLAYAYRRSLRDAARYTDRFFQLDDTVCSYEGFKQAGRQGELYDLQAEQTLAVLAGVSVQEIKYRWPVRTTAAGAVLLLSSSLLTLKADSPSLAQERRQTAQTLRATELMNEEIKDVLEQIEKEAAAQAKETPIAGDEQLQRKLAELQPTADPQEALRQYADLEKQLHKTINRLEQRRNEQLYEEMGKALRHQDGTESLGECLAKGQYQEAADELQKFQIDPNAPAAEQRQQLRNLEALAEAMTKKAQQDPSSCQAARLAEKLAQAVDNLSKVFENAELTSDSRKADAPQAQPKDSRTSSLDAEPAEQQAPPSDNSPESENPSEQSPSSKDEKTKSVETKESETQGDVPEGPEVDGELSKLPATGDAIVEDVNVAETLTKKEITKTISADKSDVEVEMSKLPKVAVSGADKTSVRHMDSGPIDPNARFTEGPDVPDSAPKVRTSDPLDNISKVVDIKDRDAEQGDSRAVLVEDVNGVNETIDAVAEHLNQIDTQCKMISKIRQLCTTLSQCQGDLSHPGSNEGMDQGKGKGEGKDQGKGEGKGEGEGKGKGEGQGKGEGEGQGQGEGKGQGDGSGNGSDGSADGGRDPGSGSSNKTNTQVTDMPASGERILLKGIPGQGPGKVKTDRAGYGSGSGSASQSRQLKLYRQQAESFVRREDVSEAVKSGVKEYFESIHKTEGGN